MLKANQDIRDYMADHGVTQKELAECIGTTPYKLCKKLSNELSQKDKEEYLNKIDSIAAEKRDAVEDEAPTEETAPAETEDSAEGTKFHIGDRVKIPSKDDKIGIVSDIWSSLARGAVMYAVADESDGHIGLYAEEHLEPAPLPIEYTFSATVENNVAVVCMIAHQGGSSWVKARGHAHILHDGEVGMAQAVSYASKRMFESLDKANSNRIYFKE